MRSKTTARADRATCEDIKRLMEVARQTARCIHVSEDGWPDHQVFPPFIKRRRGGRAVIGYDESLGAEVVGPSQVFIWIKGSGPWLGEDGELYIMTPNSSGTEFCSYPWTHEKTSRSRIEKIITHLEKLKY